MNKYHEPVATTRETWDNTVYHQPSEIAPPPQTIRRKTGWRWEIVGLGFSIGSLAATVGLLLKMSEQPLSAWNSQVSLNTIISLLAVVSRTTLMFPVMSCISQWKWTHFERQQPLRDMDIYDEASRGGFGGLGLIWRMPWKVAALGAWVSILAFVIGPFFQQVVNLQTRLVPVKDNVTAAAFGFAYEYDYKMPKIAGGNPDG